jgi:hypothetical protein
VYVDEGLFVACPCFLELKEIEQILLQKMPRPAAIRFSDVTKGALHFLQLTVRRLNIISSNFNFSIKQSWWQGAARPR